MRPSLQRFPLFLVLFFLLFAAENAKAQSFNSDEGGLKIGLGIEPGVPVGSWHDDYKYTLGGTARLEYDFNENVGITLSSGYTKFIGSTINYSYTTGGTSVSGSYTNDNYSLVPVKIGFKAYPASNFYLSTEVGAGFFLYPGSDNQKSLILSPGVGFSTDSGIDIGLRFEHYSGNDTDYGIVGLRIGYNFKL